MHSIFDIEKLEEFRKKHKLQPFRIKQIYHNIFKNSIIDFNQMTNLSKDLRQKLKENFYIVSLQPQKILDSHNTTKIAFKTTKWHTFETVLMYHYDRITGWKQDKQDYSWKYSEITQDVISTAYKVYNELWSWLQESVYQKAMKVLLEKKWYSIKTEKKIPLLVENQEVWYGKIDILVNNKIAVELKVKPEFSFSDLRQLKKYVNEKISVGLLINFGKNKVEIKRAEYNYKKNPVDPAENPANPKLNRITICLSSQIWCAVGCKFCVTGKLGFIDNLTDKEILEQIIWANNYIKQKFWKKEDGTWYKVRNVVFMWMWEPMLNYNNIKKSILMMLDQNKLSLSKRHITISTVGIIPGIKQIIADNLDVMLAISLHSADPSTRTEIIPITQKYNLDELMQVLDKYVEKTWNRIFYEYIMINDLTDTINQAKYLVNLLKWRLAHVNLIPYNENPVVNYKTSPIEKILKFKKYIENHGLTTTIRTTMWEEIKWACWQLWYEKVKNLF